MHVVTGLATGTISASESVQYSSADNIDITVFGVGTHGAAPQAGRDPVYIASQIVIALQSLISREHDQPVIAHSRSLDPKSP